MNAANIKNDSDSDLLLSATGIDKSYGTRKALNAVDITIESGEFVALLGPNGAGKTTLFQLLTGLFVPDAGKIHIAGINILKNAVPALAGIGVVFQQPTLDLDLSVMDNLRFHASLHGLSRNEARARIDEELGKLKLTDRSKDQARSLSGGQRRRVELARALLHRPQCLLMDEPTVGLDPSSRRDLLSYVLQLKQERQMAVLWASHLVDEAEQADRVIVLHKGEVLTTGAPDRLVKETGMNNLHDAFVFMTKED